MDHLGKWTAFLDSLRKAEQFLTQDLVRWWKTQQRHKAPFNADALSKGHSDSMRNPATVGFRDYVISLHLRSQAYHIYFFIITRKVCSIPCKTGRQHVEEVLF
ncbi:unnamed protein product [Protopolystoma xenopodis]|uniref:Uncharacterized protein n=1 Tax=Protopolystoma xenopodis TaxID=117903 RepID=A0A3S5A543_9PLAT|nr:unnamed protein product [Protopolystoma xenopodis]